MIRNITGLVIAVIGSYIFQIGFLIMKEDMKQKFAENFIDKFIRDL